MRNSRFPVLVLMAALLVPLGAVLPQVGASETEAGTTSERRAAALKARLAKTRLSKVKFENTKFNDVLKWLRTATGFNFMVRSKAVQQADVDLDEVTVNVELSDVSVLAFLKLVLEPHKLTVAVKGNIVLITTKADAMGKPTTRIYGIAHITWTKIDFIAPDINLPSVENPASEDYEPEVVREDDPLNNGDAVVDLLKTLVLPEDWDEYDSWSITATDTYMIVRAPRHVHRLIPAALEKIASMK